MSGAGGSAATASPGGRRRLRLVVAGLAVAIAAVVVWLAWPASEQPFLDYVAERRARGEPTTFAELGGPMPPSAENAAPEIDAALAALFATEGHMESWTVTGPWDARILGRYEEHATSQQLADLAAFLLRDGVVAPPVLSPGERLAAFPVRRR